MVEVKGRREKGKKEETKKRENNGSKESSREMGDLGQEGKSSKIQRKDQEIGFSKSSTIKLCLWKESK